jgi:hypothetical protein
MLLIKPALNPHASVFLIVRPGRGVLLLTFVSTAF